MKMLWLGLLVTTLFLSACARNPQENDTPSPGVSNTPMATPTPQATVVPEVSLQEPRQNDRVTSGFQIRGEAPGTWFFEAQLNGCVVTSGGRELGRTVLRAEGEWMTEAKVPFTGTMQFTPPGSGEEVFLEISNDNPSGLPENEKVARFPLTL